MQLYYIIYARQPDYIRSIGASRIVIVRGAHLSTSSTLSVNTFFPIGIILSIGNAVGNRYRVSDGEPQYIIK